MRIVNVWGTYIDLDHVLGIEATPEVYFMVPPTEPVRLTVHLAFRNEPFVISRAFLPDEWKEKEICGPSSAKVRPHFAVVVNPLTIEWRAVDRLTSKDRERSVAYLRAVQALYLLREFWGGRGNTDIPTIPRDSIDPDLIERADEIPEELR